MDNSESPRPKAPLSLQEKVDQARAGPGEVVADRGVAGPQPRGGPGGAERSPVEPGRGGAGREGARVPGIVYIANHPHV